MLLLLKCMQVELATSWKGEPHPRGVWREAHGCRGTQSLLLTSCMLDFAQLLLCLQSGDDLTYFTWGWGHQKYRYKVPWAWGGRNLEKMGATLMVLGEELHRRAQG